MECPSCGFQNMPGIDRCAQCSTSLASRQASESVRPPRARNRTLEQRLWWAISRVPGLRGIARWAEETSTGENAAGVGSADSVYAPSPGPFSWIPLRACGLALLSVIPGFGHIFVLRQVRQGLTMLVTSLAWLCLAAAEYRSPMADLLVWGAIAASMVSFAVTIDCLRNPDLHPGGTRRIVFAVCVTLATYLGGYTALRVALSPVVQTYTVMGRIPTATLDEGDSVLVRVMNNPLRGDVIIGGGQYGAVAGAVIGMPGDEITISDRLSVNGRAMRVALPALNVNPLGEFQDYATEDPVTLTLGIGEYWVMPYAQNGFPNHSYILRAGVVGRWDGVRGRVVAVIGPPAHRRLVRRQVLTGE